MRWLWYVLLSVSSLGAVSVARAESTTELCLPGNLLKGAHLDESDVPGASLTIDGVTPPEGTEWNDPRAARMGSSSIGLRYELASIRRVASVRVQADNNDIYVVEGSRDGSTWSRLVRIPAVSATGLRTRWQRIPQPADVQYLRLRTEEGDGRASVAEFSAFCASTPATLDDADTDDAPYVSDKRIAELKATLALLGVALFIWALAIERTGRADVDRRIRRIALGVLGTLCAAGWWNFGTFHAGKYVHTWEHFHYYVGAKYFRELGYERLYACSIVADQQLTPERDLGSRKIRNLRSNALETAAGVLQDPVEKCTRHFSEARWAHFKEDIAYFRQAIGGRWPAALHDHGYNATPVWGVLGTTVANLVPASDAGLTMLGLLDAVLIVAMFGCILWAFGWQAACLALLWWGTNYPARYFWTGGGLLRQDWLAATVIGLCLLRRDRPAAGGAMLTYAAALRIFPGFLVAGLVLKVAIELVRERTLQPLRRRARFIAGCATTGLLLFAGSSAVAGGAGSWADFAENSRKHLETPLTNNMGFKVVLSYAHDERARKTQDGTSDDPFSRWKTLRLERFESRTWGYLLALAIFLTVLGVAVTRGDDVEAVILGTGLFVMAAETTCYYYSVLLVYALLWPRRGAGLGLALCTLSYATWLAADEWGWYDELFTWASLATVLFVVGLTAVWARRPRGEALARSI